VFVAARREPRCVDALSLVRCDANPYSVPTECAPHGVTVVASVDTVRIVCGDRAVATHRRCWSRVPVFYEPVHSRAVRERKPGALDFAAPLAGWELPVCCGVLRRRREAAYGGPGTRPFIRVLRRREWADPGALTRAVEQALERGGADADAVRLILEPRRARPVGRFCRDGRPHLQSVTVPMPDRSANASLAAGGVMKTHATTSTVLLKHHLKALKRPTMTAACEKVAARCGKENVDHLGFLLQRCARELLERERRAAARRLKAARFPTPTGLDGFAFTAAPTVNKPLVLELIRCEYIERRENVILVGGSGTGKTHLAMALAAAACARGQRVRFFRVTERATRLLEAREERQLTRLRSQLRRVDLLVLDELGDVPASQVGAELLFDVIRTASERSSVIVTTNLPFEEWTAVGGPGEE
jgi:DNA replication protein DnaC